MRLSEATTALFRDNHVGDGLLQELRLPAESFPREGTWNQFPSLSAQAQQQLPRSAFNSPPLVENKSPLASTGNAALLRTFIQSNSSAVRFSPTHRVWTQEDLYALPQRWEAGCHLMVLRMVIPANSDTDQGTTTLSEPFLCVTGPMATPFRGATYDTDTIFERNPDNPDVSHPQLPSTISPTTFSLAHAPRELISKSDPKTLLSEIQSKGALITSWSYNDVHQVIPIYDRTSNLRERITQEALCRNANLWIPADPNDPMRPDATVIKPWLYDDTIPPNPNALTVWSHYPSERADTTQYWPSLREDPAFMHPETTPLGEKPGFLLTPKFLRLPRSAPFPVGLILRPSKITPDNFRTLIYELTGDPKANTQWMDNPILYTWLLAVANDPLPFAITVYPHSSVMDTLPISSPTPALSVRLHLEWSVLNQYIWDHAFANASGQAGNNEALRLFHYATSLANANNITDDENSLASKWGFIDSVYNHPFLVRLRPPSQASTSTIPGLWDVFINADNSLLPDYIRQSSSVPVDIKSKGAPSVAPLTNTPSPPPLQGTLTVDDDSVGWDARANLFSTPASGSITPSKRPPPRSAFKFTPPSAKPAVETHAKRQVASPQATSPRKSQRLDPQSTANFPQTNIPGTASLLSAAAIMPPFDVPGKTIPIIDPNASLFTSNDPTFMANPWRLPCFHEGQTRLSLLQSSNASHALATAIRQINQTLQGDPSNDRSAFQFHPDAMTNSNTSHRDIIHRMAHWGAFRCILDDDTEPCTTTQPLGRFPSDWWLAPGILNPSLLPIFQDAFRRTSSSHAVTNMTQWFQGKATSALMDYSKRGPPGRFHSSWFTPSIMSALLTFSFKPGKYISGPSEPTSIITPWHFIRSTPETISFANNKIPSDGLQALQIFDIIRNIIFLLHLCFADVHDSTLLGQGHSSFSRFSPLAGRLLVLSDFFADRSFQSRWDSSPYRECYTKAALAAVNRLWEIFDEWQEENSVPHSTYKTAQVPACSNLILLNPVCNNYTKQTLLMDLQKWDNDIKIFTIPQLERQPPADGLFNQTTPECFLSSKNHHNNSNRNNNQDTRSRHPNNANRNQNQRPPSGSTGESFHCYAARTPMIQAAAGDVKPLSMVLREANSGRPANDKITVPRIRPPNTQHTVQLCFKFCTDRSGGCKTSNGRPCKHMHIDLSDTQRCKTVAPASFYREFAQFLENDAIKRHYKPTQAFTDFLGRL